MFVRVKIGFTMGGFRQSFPILFSISGKSTRPRKYPSPWERFSHRGAVVKGVEGRRTCFDNCVSQHLSGAGSSPAGSVGRDLNLQKLNYQCLTTSVAVVLVVR